MSEFLQTVKENLVFLLVSGAIALALFLLAALLERFVLQKRKLPHTKRLTLIAMCSAVAVILHMLDFPLPFLAPEFYKVDFSELPVLLCAFYCGPSAGIACEAIKIILKLLLKGTSTAFVGDFANFVIGCSLVLPAAAIYHIKKTKTSAIWGLVAGTAVMTIFGSIFNGLYLLPKFSQLYGLPLDAIVGMGAAINGGIHSVSTLVIFAVAPLNFLKAAVVSILTMLLYKRIQKPLFGKIAS